MKKLLLSSLFLFSITFVFAQTWDGGGDGTSWNDPLNWDNDLVPATGETVTFSSDATVTGSAPNVPERVMVDNGNTVTLDMDLNIGNGIFNNHGIKIQGNAVLNLGTPSSNRTFIIRVRPNKFGILHNANGSPATINIAASTTVNIIQSKSGISITGTGGNIVSNSGTLNISNPTQNGILNESGAITNNAGGVITITSSGEDGINLTGGTFDNAGIVNTSGGAMNADNGISGGAGSTLTNTGTMTFTGGNAPRRFLVDGGVVINEPCGIVDMTDGRLRVENNGSFTNNGLIRSSFSGTGIFITSSGGTATNNAFFDYTNSNTFAAGGSGIINNNGININVPANLTVDAAGSCSVADLGIDAPYEWFRDAANAHSVGNSDAAGAIAFDNDAFLTGGTNMIFTCYGADVAFTVNNLSGLCVPALPPAIPTMSQWGMIVFALLMLNMGVVFVYRQQLAMAGGQQCADSFSIRTLPFKKVLFGKYFVRVLLAIGLVGLISIIGFGYELMPFDVSGSILSAGLLAFLFQLIAVEESKG